MNKVEQKTSFLNNQYAQLRKQISQQHIFSPFVSNPAYIKPEMSQGYLLQKRGLIPSAVIATKDTANDVVELTRALATGKSCDNSLGRMNDLGLKLGGLGIAAYLAAKRGTKTKGLMEFIGLGTFFTSMTLWPRLLIAKPLEKRFGFDIRQKYIDSQGRKKSFFQDNQYLPWDIWKDEDIDKIGDKMGIEKNIPERRELIKQKMRSIALQGNTLWMLTAGFSPLFTSLACNLAERGVTAATINSQYAKALKTAENMGEAVEAYAKSPTFDSGARKELKKLLAEYDGVAPDEKFFNKAAELLDPVRLIQDSKDVDGANLVEGMASSKLEIKKGLEQVYNAMCPEDTKVVSFDTLSKKIKTITASNAYGTNRVSIADKVLPAIEKIYAITDDTRSTEVNVQTVLDKIDELVPDKLTAKTMKQEVLARLKGVEIKRDASPREFYKGVQELFDATSKGLNARTKVVADTINAVAGQKYESAYTNIHLKSVKAFMEELQPSIGDLGKARKDSQASFEYLTKALSQKAQNADAYSAFIENIAEKQAKYESKDIRSVLDKVVDFSKGTFKKFFDEMDEATGTVKKYPKPFGFIRNIVLGGEDGLKSAFNRTIEGFIEEKTAGIKATSHRMIMAADLERRIASGTLEKQWLDLGGDKSRFEQVCEIARKAVYNSTMNDIANKQYLTGNGKEAAKIFNLIYLQDMDKATKGSGLTEAVLESVNNARKAIFGVYNGVVDLARQGHKLKDAPVTLAAQKTQYAMIGKPLSDLFMETASKTFNDKRWMKMFGGLAAVVAGVTLISQMFFGKVKDEELYKTAKKQEGVNNAK